MTETGTGVACNSSELFFREVAISRCERAVRARGNRLSPLKLREWKESNTATGYIDTDVVIASFGKSSVFTKGGRGGGERDVPKAKQPSINF